jgi:hypothetical protein
LLAGAEGWAVLLMAKVIYLDGINVIDLAQGQEKNKAGAGISYRCHSVRVI